MQFDLSWRDDKHKNNLQCMWVHKKHQRIKPLSLYSVLPNNAVYGLFVIRGPLTVSAVLISLRWIFPNPANIQVVQNVPAAPKAKGERGELNIKMSTVVSFAAYQSLLEKKKKCGKQQLLKLSSWTMESVLFYFILWSKIHSEISIDKLINDCLN